MNINNSKYIFYAFNKKWKSIRECFLDDAAVATKVDLQGNSKMLNVLANTSDENDNITVDGKIPDRDANYSSIEIEENED